MWLDRGYVLYFFFFQAEDGIRDADVTGVQTCALPISGRPDAVAADTAVTPVTTDGPLRSPRRPEACPCPAAWAATAPAGRASAAGVADPFPCGRSTSVRRSARDDPAPGARDTSNRRPRSAPVRRRARTTGSSTGHGSVVACPFRRGASAYRRKRPRRQRPTARPVRLRAG